MPEACIICCDSSEWMRNGDFTPNRFDAQKEAIHMLCGAKTQQNQENTVGLIRMGGRKKAEVLVNCTGDVGRIYTATQRMNISGESDILVAIQTAQLALKHRKNKRQTQRIIIFVGSPVTTPEKQLIRAGKKLKKNNVAVDVVNFGESEHNRSILQAFVDAVKNNDNSNIVNFESGMDRLLSDLLVASPIIGGGGGGGAAAMGGDFGGIPDAAAGGDDMGLDPNMDPDLRMALMMSLQEERARQEAAAAQAMQESAESAGVAPADGGAGGGGGSGEAMEVDDEDDDELAMLQEAIQMSLREAGDGQAVPAAETAAAGGDAQNDQNDEDFLGQLLEELPGVNQDDLDMDALLENLGNDDDEDDNNKDGNKGNGN